MPEACRSPRDRIEHTRKREVSRPLIGFWTRGGKVVTRAERSWRKGRLSRWRKSRARTRGLSGAAPEKPRARRVEVPKQKARRSTSMRQREAAE